MIWPRRCFAAICKSERDRGTTTRLARQSLTHGPSANLPDSLWERHLTTIVVADIVPCLPCAIIWAIRRSNGFGERENETCIHTDSSGLG